MISLVILIDRLQNLHDSLVNVSIYSRHTRSRIELFIAKHSHEDSNLDREMSGKKKNKFFFFVEEMVRDLKQDGLTGVTWVLVNDVAGNAEWSRLGEAERSDLTVRMANSVDIRASNICWFLV